MPIILAPSNPHSFSFLFLHNPFFPNSSSSIQAYFLLLFHFFTTTTAELLTPLSRFGTTSFLFLLYSWLIILLSSSFANTGGLSLKVCLCIPCVSLFSLPTRRLDKCKTGTGKLKKWITRSYVVVGCRSVDSERYLMELDLWRTGRVLLFLVAPGLSDSRMSIKLDVTGTLGSYSD